MTTIGIVLSDAIEAVTAVGGTVSFTFSLSDETVPPLTFAPALALALALGATCKVTTLFPLCPVNFLHTVVTVLLAASSGGQDDGDEYLVYLLRSSWSASCMKKRKEEREREKERGRMRE